jgi:hypothetical protein
MIVAVCADKGSPGVTTLEAVLGLVWPGERLVVEADPSGADLPFRLKAPGEGSLRAEPSVLSLAADARVGLPEEGLPRFAQETTLGLPVIPGALSAEGFLPMRALWPQVAAELAGWRGTAIADLGRLQPGHAGVQVAQAAGVVVLMARPTLEGLFRLRDRVSEVAQLLGDPGRGRSPLVVVVRAHPRTTRHAVATVRQMLAAAGSPIPVAGAFADDPEGADALWAGRLDRRLTRSALVSSARAVAGQLLDWWPHLWSHAGEAAQDAADPAGRWTRPPSAAGAGRSAS